MQFAGTVNAAHEDLLYIRCAARTRDEHHRTGVVRGQRPGDVEPLDGLAVQRPERRQLDLVLDTLGDRRQSDRVGALHHQVQQATGRARDRPVARDTGAPAALAPPVPLPRRLGKARRRVARHRRPAGRADEDQQTGARLEPGTGAERPTIR